MTTTVVIVTAAAFLCAHLGRRGVGVGGVLHLVDATIHPTTTRLADGLPRGPVASLRSA